MDKIEHLALTLSRLPSETLAMLVGLGALGVAALAIYAMMTVARRGKD